MAFLKDGTEHHHHQLDSHDLYRQLLSTDLKLSDYKQILKIFFEWQITMHSRVNSLSSDNISFLNEPMIERLKIDLNNLNIPIVIQNKFKSANYSTAYQLGVLYVLQGATLGGQIIAPKVEKTLARNDITAYLRGPKENTYKFWEETSKFINTTLVDDESKHEALTGAKESFDYMLELTHAMQGAA